MTNDKILKIIENLAFVVFLLVYWKLDLKMATVALMGWLSFLVLLAKILNEPLSKMQFYSWVAVMFLGTLTLVFDNELFIKFKMSLTNIALASTLAVSHIWGKKTIFERLFDSHLKAPKAMLRKLSCATILYLLFAAGLNYYVAESFDTQTWFKFKYIGMFILNALFIISALFYLKDYLKNIALSLEENQKK